MGAVYRRSSVVLCKTRETLNSIPRQYRDKCRLQLEIGTERRDPFAPSHRSFGHESALIFEPSLSDPVRVSRPALRVLYVGRLVYLKGMHLGIPAFARLLESGINATLTVVGSGPEEQRLKRLASKLGIAHAIEWRPWLRQEEVMQVYPQHDVFLFPSLHDSSGNAVLEAMSFGLPVVCLDLGGPGVLVDENSGIRVSGANEALVISELSDAMRVLADDRLRREISDGAIARAHHYFSWPKQTERMSRIYASLAMQSAT